jgi:hypothetical protein
MTFQLTKTDIQKLRSATRVIFGDHRGVGFMTAVRTKGHRSGAAQIWDHTVAVGTDHTIFDNPEGQRATFFDAHYVANYAYDDIKWRTIANFLRPGDVIRLSWSAGAQTTLALERAGFVGDTLTLFVYRKDKKIAGFQVGSIICPVLSSARMITLTYRPLEAAA